MFYIATNQICTITGIQDDASKEHNHSIYHTHNISSSGPHTHTIEKMSFNGVVSIKSTVEKSTRHYKTSGGGTYIVVGGGSGYEDTIESLYANGSFNKSQFNHSHTINEESGNHTHTTAEPSKTTSGDFGGTETRPKNRLIKIWRRTL